MDNSDLLGLLFSSVPIGLQIAIGNIPSSPEAKLIPIAHPIHD